MWALGLQAEIRPIKRRTTNSVHGFRRYPNLVQDLRIARPDQAWLADLTYVRLQQESVYLAVLMDVFPRSIRGWHLGRVLDQELTLTALQKALADRVPEVHHSDQGVEYAASEYVALLQDYGVQIAWPKSVNQSKRLCRAADPDDPAGGT